VSYVYAYCMACVKVKQACMALVYDRYMCPACIKVDTKRLKANNGMV
jgi:hypothetical protein